MEIKKQDLFNYTDLELVDFLNAHWKYCRGIEVLRLSYSFFRNELALLSSFGAESALLLSMVSEIDPHWPVLFLNTQKHFQETIKYKKELQQSLGLRNIIELIPSADDINALDPLGNLWNLNPDKCCNIRKVNPLLRAIKSRGIKAIITGRKKYQGLTRKSLKLIEFDSKGYLTINPLYSFDQEDIESEFKKRGLLKHPLTFQNYPSIGCEPCTQPVEEGESDLRKGRWAHTQERGKDQKTECGLHY